ncbi:MAG: glycosyltransferase family A protein [Pseudomonadota bacterium]
MKTVSIIIPCFNKAAYIAQAIDSALNQSHPCEVIVIDDGSTDDSLNTIKAYDDRLHWVTGPNRGACAARNMGIELASGDMLQFLDADDAIPPNKIEAQLGSLEGAPPGSVSYCPWSFLDEENTLSPRRELIDNVYSGSDLLRTMWYYGGFLPTVVWLTPKELVASAGAWDESLHADQDGEFFGRMLLSASKVRSAMNTLAYYRRPPQGSISLSKTENAAASRLAAYEIISTKLLGYDDSVKTRKACLARLRTLAYHLQDNTKVFEKALDLELELRTRDFSPTLPWPTRFLVGLFGLRLGLLTRKVLFSVGLGLIINSK